LLKDRAYNQLKDLLLSGEAAGEPFLSERRLALRLGMSNTPVRSAIERLESEGIIAISAQRGIVLREPTDREIADHYEIRELIEPYVVRRLAGRLSAEQMAALRENTDGYAAAVESGDIRRTIRVDGEFHLLLCGFLGNADITRSLMQLRARIYRVILRAAGLMPGRLSVSVQEHRRIVEALAAGDGQAAAAAMTEHMRRGRDLLLPHWNR
jgi:DNA-binding GntR family transcriptional regulator